MSEGLTVVNKLMKADEFISLLQDRLDGKTAHTPLSVLGWEEHAGRSYLVIGTLLQRWTILVITEADRLLIYHKLVHLTMKHAADNRNELARTFGRREVCVWNKELRVVAGTITKEGTTRPYLGIFKDVPTGGSDKELVQQRIGDKAEIVGELVCVEITAAGEVRHGD